MSFALTSHGFLGHCPSIWVNPENLGIFKSFVSGNSNLLPFETSGLIFLRFKHSKPLGILQRVSSVSAILNESIIPSKLFQDLPKVTQSWQFHDNLKRTSLFTFSSMFNNLNFVHNLITRHLFVFNLKLHNKNFTVSYKFRK